METLLNDNLTGENHQSKNANTPLRYLTASSIMGDKVCNCQDEKLGDIKDIMIDLRDGTIEYLVIEFGGFLGMGEKYFAVPFRLFEVDADKEMFIIDLKRDDLERAACRARLPKSYACLAGGQGLCYKWHYKLLIPNAIRPEIVL